MSTGMRAVIAAGPSGPEVLRIVERPRPVALKACLAEALAEHVLPLLAAGRARPPVDSVFPFDRVAEAHARMDAGQHIGKIVLSMGEIVRGSR